MMNAIESTLPALENTYLVEDQAIADYQKNGHVLLPQLALTEEIASYRQAISEAVERYNTETRSIIERDTYGKAFLQIVNLWERDAAVRRFTLANRFARAAAQLMGCERVRIYHDQALYKEPGGGPTPWHQDQYYWPLDTDQTITMWMPLVDITSEMGIMAFASGSQTQGYVDKLGISDESQSYLDNYVREKGFQVTSAPAMQAGDATFHAGWTLHAAPGNQSDTMREVMTIIFFADGARAIEPDNKGRVADLARWMPGIYPGQVVASELNPLL